VLLRTSWPKLRHAWLEAEQGGTILSAPRVYLACVALPSLAAYTLKLGVVAVFLAAFTIPVTFGSVMHVVAGNSIANAHGGGPGRAGVNQAIRLHDEEEEFRVEWPGDELSLLGLIAFFAVVSPGLVRALRGSRLTTVAARASGRATFDPSAASGGASSTATTGSSRQGSRWLLLSAGSSPSALSTPGGGCRTPSWRLSSRRSGGLRGAQG
jgi:hypothetical protein